MSDRDDPECYGPVEAPVRYCRDCGGRIGLRGCGDWRCPGFIPEDDEPEDDETSVLVEADTERVVNEYPTRHEAQREMDRREEDGVPFDLMKRDQRGNLSTEI